MYSGFVVIHKGTVLSTARHAQGHKLLARNKVNKSGLYLGNHFVQGCLPLHYLRNFSQFLLVSELHCKDQVANNPTKPHTLLSISLRKEKWTVSERVWASSWAQRYPNGFFSSLWSKLWSGNIQNHFLRPLTLAKTWIHKPQAFKVVTSQFSRAIHLQPGMPKF